MGSHFTTLTRFGALAIFMAATPAFAATRAARAEAVALKPLSIVNRTDLEFGTLISSPVAGTVSINPTNDARTTTGGVTAASGGPHAAQFLTASTGNQFLQVNHNGLPTLTHTGGVATMKVTQLTLNGPVLRFIGPSGVLDLRVGGTLAVSANQLDGQYTGTFQITVTYF